MNAPSGALFDTEALALRLRRHSVLMCSRGGSSHVGSNLSMADIVAMLYGEVLRLAPEDPGWPDRDRFILSKGHACACIYAALAERGFFPISWLSEHYRNGSIFAGHLTHRNIPGVEASTGSLGHGLGLAAGMAMQLRRGGGGQRVYALLSDGECDEGSIWEAAMFAGHHRLGNLCAIVDYNKIQGIARTEDAIGLEPLDEKWRAFGWAVRRIDGHDHGALRGAFAAARHDAAPTCIIADTVKGRGISFMENSILWHYRIPRGEELAAGLRELGMEMEATHA